MARDKITMQHRLEYAGWLLVAGSLKVVPRSLMILAADGAGWMMYHVLCIRRDIIDQQLEIAFGDSMTDAERRKIGAKSWQNCVLTFFEFLQPSPWLSKGWDTFREQEGYEENCVPLKEQHGNALIITGHLGNWEALGSLAERENVQLAAVAKAMHNPLVNNYILKSRAARGLEVLQLKGNMKGIVDAVRHGKWVALVGDQDARRSGIFVDFFGKPASTAVGAAHFTWKLNKPLMPSFCVRMPDAGRHLKLIFMEPIIPNPDADRDEESHRITQLHTKALEDVIRRYPSDYFWLHRRWKTQPKKKKSAQ